MNLSMCPCGSALLYTKCCGLRHTGELPAQSAEQLMRSRFSAFKLKDIDYLEQTLDPSQCKPNEKLALKEALSSTEWLSLRIIKSNAYTVEFVAFHQGNPFSQLHEKSNFSLIDGKWYYVDGQILPDIKIGRNDTCPCGSLKKVKKCCRI